MYYNPEIYAKIIFMFNFYMVHVCNFNGNGLPRIIAHSKIVTAGKGQAHVHVER